LSVPVALASPAAYWIGIAGIPAVSVGVDSPTSAGALLVVATAIHWCGRRMLYGQARSADAALARADQDASEQYAILSRNIERREHERLVHDTVLNTLTALSRAAPGDLAGVANRCRSDVRLLEHALGDPADQDPETASPYGALVGRLEAVADEMRGRGLDVHVEVGESVRAVAAEPDDGGRRDGPLAAPAVPAPVATAIVHATREALANVAAHAGTGEAWLQVGLGGTDGEPAAPDALHVSVRDEGPGFDPDRIGSARLGLRRSVIERIADWGGRASISSGPGEGTVVSLHWPGSRREQAAAGRPGRTRGRPGRRGGQAVTNRGEVVRYATESGIARVVGAAAVILPFMLLVQVLAHPENYRQPAVPVAVWIGNLLAAAWLLRRTRGRGLTAAEAAIAVGLALATVVLVEWERRASSSAVTVNWTVLGTVWPLALVALSRRPWTGMAGGLAVFTVNAVFVIRALGPRALTVAQLTAAAYVVSLILSVFAGLRPALRTQADMAARRASLASDSAAERAAVAAVHRERRGRLALLEEEALPLLRGIADGTLEPAEDKVRQKCAEHAAALRQSLADRAWSAGGSVAWLEPMLRSARRAGLLVEVRVVGDPGEPAPEVAAAALAAVRGVLGVLPPCPATLTVLGSGADVELYLTFTAPSPAPPCLSGPAGLDLAGLDLAGLGARLPTTACWRATLDVEETGAGCLEAGWRKALAA
jgi:hypothetical protein